MTETVLDPTEIKTLVATAWTGENVTVGTAIVLAESGGRVAVYNGTCCYGLWQININHGYTVAQMTNPVTATIAAKKIYDEAGGWDPWEAYTTSEYRNYLAEASGTGTVRNASLLSSLGKLGTPLTGPVEAAGELLGGAGKTLSGVGDIGDSVEGFYKLFKFLFSEAGWLRILKVVGGGVLLLIAIDSLSKQSGGPEITKPITSTASKASSLPFAEAGLA